MILDLESFKLAVEYSPNQIVITNLEGKILYANPALEKISGFSREEVMGKTPKVWGEQMDKSYYDNMWRVLKDEKKPFKGELKNKKKNGEIYDARICIIPILDDKSQVYGYVSIEENITKEKEMENMRNEFLSIAAHQLRSPLGRMRWYIEMLLSGDVGVLTPEIRDTLNDIYENNMRTIIQVNELLNISRLDQGRIVTSHDITSVVEIIKHVTVEMKALAQKKSLEIEMKGTDEFHNYYIVNSDLFREIVMNLVNNAVKYNRSGGKITVGIEATEDSLQISIADTGIGIPEVDKGKIFNKFFRASNAVEYVNEGTGLGLYIVKAFINQWKGRIWFDSFESKGSTFYISIPLAGNIEIRKEK